MSHVRLLSAIVSAVLLVVFLWPAVQPAFAQNLIPDGIEFVDGPMVLASGGNGYVLDLQLTMYGINYSGNHFDIYLVSSDPSLIDIPRGTSITSDSNGRAVFNFTTGQGHGNVTITASLMSPVGDIRNSETYAVVASGNVTGTVVDAGNRRISGAAVTLYSLAGGSVTPIKANQVMTSEQGTYAFESVPYGSYTIEAAISDYNGSANVTVSGPDQNADITISGYTAPTPSPTPEPSATPTEQPSPTTTLTPTSPTPEPKTPTGDATKQLTWIVAAAIVLAAIIVCVQWLRKRKPKK